MKDEIKEILEALKPHNKEFAKAGIKEYSLVLSVKEQKILLDYITNLQEKLKVSQTNEETYRLEMQDITKCLGLKEDTTFDEVKEYATNLQQELKEANDSITWWTNRFNAVERENNRLKELCDKYEEEHNTTFEYWKQLVKEDYKSRNEKAIEFLEHFDSGQQCEHTKDLAIIIENILQGEDKE